MKNNFVKIITSGTVGLLSSTALFGVQTQANAADFGPIVPGGSVANKFDINGTMTIKSFEVGDPDTEEDNLVYLDFVPLSAAGNAPEDGDQPGMAISKQPLFERTDGAYTYAFFDSGLGFFDDFESGGAPGNPNPNPQPAQGVIKDVYFPTVFDPVAGFAVSVPKFLAMDSQDIPPITPGLALDPMTGPNFYNLERIFGIELTQFGSPGAGLRTDLSFSTSGTYTQEDMDGNVVIS